MKSRIPIMCGNSETSSRVSVRAMRRLVRHRRSWVIPCRRDPKRGSASMRKQYWRRIMVLAVGSTLLTLGSACPTAIADENGLRQLTISAAMASSSAMQFQDYESEPLDIEDQMTHGLEAKIKSYQVGVQRTVKQVLNGWDTRFASIDTDPITGTRMAMLQIRLIEYSSHYWADRLRGDANLTAPSSFPAGTRYTALDNANGTRTTIASAPKGRLTAMVYLHAQPGVTIDPASTEAVLSHVLRVQLDKLPLLADLDDTDVSYGDMRAGLIIVQALAIPLIAILFASASFLRDFGSLEALSAPKEVSAAIPRRRYEFVDLTDRTRKMRRRGRRRSVLTMALISLLSAGLMLTQIVTKLPSILVIPLGFLLAGVLYGLYLHRRSDSSWSGSLNNLRPALMGMLGAFVVVLLVTYFLLSAIGLVFVYDFGSMLVKVVLVFALGAIGMWLLRFTAWPLQLAKRKAQVSVDRALADDPRQEIMLLRSFQDDDLMMRMHRSARHSAIELASAQTIERFEELIAWLLWRYGPVVAFGQPGTQSKLQPLGAAREFHEDTNWQESARARMASSSLIVFVVGRSPSLAWEVHVALGEGRLGKCLFIVPPVDIDEARCRLLVLASALGIDPSAIPADTGKRTIGLYLDEAGRPVVVGVDGRDDFAYEVLCDHAVPTLIRRTRTLDSVAASVRGAEVNIDPYVVTFRAGAKNNEPPRIRDGLRLLLRSLRERRAGNRANNSLGTR